jgi:hypothetical protein
MTKVALLVELKAKLGKDRELEAIDDLTNPWLSLHY